MQQAKAFSTQFITAIACLAVAAALSSCHTSRGFGRDLQKVGNKIEREASKRL